MTEKYHLEKSAFGDETIIRDKYGAKVGYSQKSLFGDHVNIYDKHGQKIGEQCESFLGDHINVYDAHGKKVGEQRESFFGDHTNLYDAHGTKIGEACQPVFGPGTNVYINRPAKTQNYEPPEPAAPRPKPTRRSCAPGDDMPAPFVKNSLTTEEQDWVARHPCRLTPQEAAGYGQECARRLKRALVRTTSHTYKYVYIKKGEKTGFLFKTTNQKSRFSKVPLQKCWVLRVKEGISKTSKVEMHHKFTLLLTVNGEFFVEEEQIRYFLTEPADYHLDRHSWDKIEPAKLPSVVPVLDLFLHKHHIRLSSEQYWSELHPHGTVQHTPRKKYEYVLTLPKTGDPNRLIKAYRACNGVGLDKARTWLQSNNSVVYQTNDKDKLTEAMKVLCVEYGLQPALNGRTIVVQKSSNQKQSPTKAINPNAPCPCGSGKKYKQCCGKNRSPQ